jgi:hypothetical protein
LQVNALQSANATLSEALVLAREELSGKPGGSMEQQLAAVSIAYFMGAPACCIADMPVCLRIVERKAEPGSQVAAWSSSWQR